MLKGIPEPSVSVDRPTQTTRRRHKAPDAPRMLRSANHLIGYSMRATDGDLGHAKDFLFDDLSWIVRYVVADTGSVLPGVQVLISPTALQTPMWENRLLPVNMSKQSIMDGPNLRAHLPVSRQTEEALVATYGWPAYWTGFMPPIPGLDGSTMAIRSKQVKAERKRQDPHLRSVREVVGYSVHCTDGKIGDVDDFIIETNTWTVHYLVIDTRPWWFGGRVLIAPAWCENIDWNKRMARVGLPREHVKNAPAYDPSKPVNRNDDRRLIRYLDCRGRPRPSL